MIKEYSERLTTLGSVFVIALYLITHSNGAHIPADLAMALKVAQSSNDLGIQLYLILSSTDRVNVVFSPLALMIALGTTKLGPRGGRNTLDEVSEVLHLKTRTVYNHLEQLNKLVINERNDGVNLEVKNFLLVKDESKKKAKYRNEVRFDHQEDVIQTNNKNDTFLDDYFSDGGRMDLLNKALFQAHWEIPFTVFKRFPFSTSGNEDLSNKKVQVEFMGLMSDENQLNYFDDGEHRCQVLELNYGKDIMPDQWDARYYPADVSMVIILPYADQPLWKMEEILSSETIESWISRLKATNIDVSIPKFNISGFLDVGLPLKELGIRSMFSPSTREPIEEETGNLRSLWQETSIAATETGTEKPQEPPEDLSIVLISNPAKTFQADRPFLFFVRDKLTNAILLMGRVMNPID